MCVVIDADTFSEIVDDKNSDFEPLRQWIREVGHKVIYGGSKYAEHLLKHGKFRRYLRGLERTGNTHKENDQEINNCDTFLKGTFIATKYNDHHIAAILFVSGCKIVSSHDQGLHTLIKDCCSSSGKSIIMQNMPILRVTRPKIYQNQSHQSFLNRRSVSHCCV